MKKQEERKEGEEEREEEEEEEREEQESKLFLNEIKDIIGHNNNNNLIYKSIQNDLSLQAVIFIEIYKNNKNQNNKEENNDNNNNNNEETSYLYIYRDNKFTNSEELNYVTRSLIKEWKNRNKQNQFVNNSLNAIFSPEDLIVKNVLIDIGFIPPKTESEIVYEIILHPLLSLNNILSTEEQPIPEQIFLLMGQSNMSGRGPIFGEHGLLPYNPLSTNNENKNEDKNEQKLDELMKEVQNNLLSTRVYSQNFNSLEYHPLKINHNNDDNNNSLIDSITVSYSEKYYHKIVNYNISSCQWSFIDDITIIHKLTDRLKSVGLGPGITFASHYLDLNQNISRIGLVPLAVGATSSIEWMPDYLPIQQLNENFSNNQSYLTSPSNIFLTGIDNINNIHNSTLNQDNTLPPLFCNLFSCAMRTIFLSLYSIFSSSNHPIHLIQDYHSRVLLIYQTISGIIWYQGCNDAVPSNDLTIPSLSSNYTTRLISFLSYLRLYVKLIALQLEEVLFPLSTNYQQEEDEEDIDYFNINIDLNDELNISLSSIPIINVSITATRPWMKNTQDIRYQQLSIRNQSNLNQSILPLFTVDALGGILQYDCVHLNSHSYFRLGYLFAYCMKNLITEQMNFNSNKIEYFYDYLHLSSFDEYLTSLYSLCRLLTEDILESHYLVKRDPYYSSQLFLSPYDENLLNNEQTIEITRKKLPILQTNLKAVNFVYGEISFHSILQIFREIYRIDSIYTSRISLNLNLFVDLGCGSCISLIAAYLTGYFKSVMGIDMMKSKLEIGYTLQEIIRIYFTNLLAIFNQNITEIEINETLLSNPLSLFPSFSSYSIESQESIQQFVNKYCKFLSTISLEKLSFILFQSLNQTLTSCTVQIREGNFLNWKTLSLDEWKQIKVLYICSTCYHDDDLMKILYEEKFIHLSIGSYIILLDKLLPTYLVNINEKNTRNNIINDENNERKVLFELSSSCQCRTSWGVASAYIYRCIG